MYDLLQAHLIGSACLRWLTGHLLLLPAPAWHLRRLLLALYLGEFGLGKHLSLRQSQDYLFSPEITSTFIVFEGKQNLIIEVKEEYASGFSKMCLKVGRVFTHLGDCTLCKREEFCSCNSLLEDSLSHHSPHLLKCPPNGYGRRTCKLISHWVEKHLKFWTIIKIPPF